MMSPFYCAGGVGQPGNRTDAGFPTTLVTKWSITSPLAGTHRDSRPAVCPLAGHRPEQVLRLEAALRQSRNEHNARVPRDMWLETGRSKRSSASPSRPAGRLPAAGVHDARPRRGGGEPIERLSRAEGGGCIGVEDKPSKKGTGFHQPQKPHEHWHIDIAT